MLGKLAWQNTLFLTLIFSVLDMAAIRLGGNASLLHCRTAKTTLFQAASYSSELPSFSGFQKIYLDSRFLIQHMAMPAKRHFCFLHDHTTWECITHGFKLPFLLWNMVLDDDKAAFWWDSEKNFQRWCLIRIFCRKLNSFDFHAKYHLYVTFVFKGRSSFKNTQYGLWALNVSTNHCTSTRKFYYYYVTQERYLNTIRCNRAFTNAKTNVLNHDELYLHILEIFLFRTTG